MLNFFRNPYILHRILALAKDHNYHNLIMSFSYPDLIEIDNAICECKNPKLESFCKEYNITVDEYKAWMQLLAVLTYPKHPNSLHNITSRMFNSNAVAADVYQYTKYKVLLSDTGGVELINNQTDQLIYGFNSNTFAIYSFTNPKLDDDFKLLLNNDKEQIEHAEKLLVTEPFTPNHWDDLEKLAMFNKAIILQAHQYVYCASKEVYGVTVLPPNQ